MKKKLLVLPIALGIAQASAFQFDTGDDWEVRWDNTFKFNVISRVAKQSDEVLTTKRGAGFFLADDADMSVDRSNGGIVSTRFDVFSELDVIYNDNFGFRLSGSAWYDPAYKDSDHPKDRYFTWASPSVKPGEYNDAAKSLHYAGGELLDAFVFANFDFGDMAASVRLGRHTIYWGNSLLAGGAINSIGGSMAPLDFAKAFSVPGTEAKELFMPFNKLSTVIQLTDNLTLNAYYGFEHLRYRLPASGTYFSPAEGLAERSSEFITFPPGSPASPIRTGFGTDRDATEDNEWGVNVQYYFEDLGLETSFIYLNYVDKNLHGLHGGFDLGQFAGARAANGDATSKALLGAWSAMCAGGAIACPNAPAIDASAGTLQYGMARWLFKEDIDLFAVSFAKEIGGVSVGLDIVHRQGTGLAPGLAQSLQRVFNVPKPLQPVIEANLPLPVIEGDFYAYDSSNYLGPVGDTWHVIVNGLGFLQDNGIWEGGSYIVEATAAWLDDCTAGCSLLDPRVKEGRVVTAVSAVFNPTWYQVLPGWDVTVPVSVSYTIDGEKHPLTFGGDEDRGSGSIGVRANINETWNVQARYNVYFGPVKAGIGGLLKDRDNVSLTIKRTF